MATRRRVMWIVGGAGLLLVAWLVTRPSGVVVDVAEVVRAPLEVLVSEAGETRAVNHTLVSAPAAGRLRPLVRDEGSPVQASATLAMLEPVALDVRARAEADARLARAEAARTSARAQLRSADSALADAARAKSRAESLARAGAVAARDAETAALAFAAAEDARRMAEASGREVEAEWRAARAALAEGGAPVPVRAPVGGRVLTVHERDARVVAPGTPLVTIGDTEAMEIRLDVLSRDALRIAAGQPMRLDLGPGLEAEPGEVVRVEPGGFAKLSPLGVEERRVRVIGRPSRPLLGVGDGYRVQAAVIVWSAEQVLQVPASAFVRDADGWAVYVVTDGRIRRRAVVPGERGEQAWEVREGLAEGEAVIRFPGAEVREGERARVAAGR